MGLSIQKGRIRLCCKKFWNVYTLWDFRVAFLFQWCREMSREQFVDTSQIFEFVNQYIKIL